MSISSFTRAMWAAATSSIALRQIAPVFAVRGNTDYEEWARALPLTERVQIDQHLIFVLHD